VWKLTPHLGSISAHGFKTLACVEQLLEPWFYSLLLSVKASQPALAFYQTDDRQGRRGSLAMIEVTRLNGISMLVNSDLIKIAEASPDTMLTLIHGEKLIIRESCSELMEKILEYRATLLAAVADRLGASPGSRGEVHRVVSLASLNPESGVTLVGAGSTSNGNAAVRNGSGLKLEPTGRS